MTYTDKLVANRYQEFSAFSCLLFLSDMLMAMSNSITEANAEMRAI
jgi:hypothetical protein